MGDEERRDARSGLGHGARPRGPNAGWSAVGLGFEMAVTIALCTYAGLWLDRKLGTEPWLLIVGVFFGAGAGFYSVYRTLTTLQHRREEERGDRGTRGGGGGEE